MSIFWKEKISERKKLKILSILKYQKENIKYSVEFSV